jgi:phosphoglycolate phosphatase
LSGQETRLLAVDLDGTLVDSAPDIAHCLGTALEAIGFAPPGEARTRVWIGDGIETLIARAIAHDCSRHGEAAFASEARQRAALAAFLGCYRDNLFVRSRLYPGVPETLEALRARGVQLCCITNKRHAFSEELLTRAGIRGHFALVLGGDSLAEKKPSPLQLKVAAETLGTAPSAATLVGDSHQDLRAARAAGYGFVLAAYGYGKIDETELGASPRIRSFVELPAALGLGR